MWGPLGWPHGGWLQGGPSHATPQQLTQLQMPLREDQGLWLSLLPLGHLQRG